MNGWKIGAESFPVMAILGVVSTNECPLATRVTCKLYTDFSGKNKALKSETLFPIPNMTV
jgi:hypothetical protein